MRTLYLMDTMDSTESIVDGKQEINDESFVEELIANRDRFLTIIYNKEGKDSKTEITKELYDAVFEYIQAKDENSHTINDKEQVLTELHNKYKQEVEEYRNDVR